MTPDGNFKPRDWFFDVCQLDRDVQAQLLARTSRHTWQRQLTQPEWHSSVTLRGEVLASDPRSTLSKL